jgi:hypothetical protein
MNRLGVSLFALVAVAVGASCTDTNSTIYILRNQVLTNGCDIPAGTGTDFISFGELDVTDPIPGTNLLNPGYILAAAVQNGTTADITLPNAHIFFAEGADVELRGNGSDASSSTLTALAVRGLDKRTQYFSGSIAPGGTGGFGIFIIDADQTAALGDVLGSQPVQLIARTKVFGTIDGSDVTADPFDYPVTVCKGCLVNVIGPCSALTAGSTTTFSEGGMCNKIQDASLDCCTLDASDTSGDGLECPPIPPTT